MIIELRQLWYQTATERAAFNNSSCAASPAQPHC